MYGFYLEGCLTCEELVGVTHSQTVRQSTKSYSKLIKRNLLILLLYPMVFLQEKNDLSLVNDLQPYMNNIVAIFPWV